MTIWQGDMIIGLLCLALDTVGWHSLFMRLSGLLWIAVGLLTFFSGFPS